MARKPNDPNSASCQFFIALVRAEDLDEQYTVIGQAQDAESLRTLQQLAALPTDEKHRPLRPVLIRSVSLVDTETRQRADQLETTRP
jgi:cyclophilin family peptidyl-prolyl cis-trans isomerase